jgi:hypothetical protein
MRQFLANNLKNIRGWKTNRKLVAFAVDDYGNVRLHSSRAKENLLKDGVALKNRFDKSDALDTVDDYLALFDVLSTVKDRSLKPAVFTPYALSCNCDFEATLVHRHYVPETLEVTYNKMASEYPKSYDGALNLLKKGINEGLIKPQFHGREHLNITVVNAHLKEMSSILLSNLQNKSMAGIPDHTSFKNVSFNQAFAFWSVNEIALHKEIIQDGLKVFEQVYGYPSLTFTPPAQQLHQDLYPYVSSLGVIGLDKVRNANRHLGEGKYVKETNVMGDPISPTATTIVRNCVFEPTDDRGVDWVNYTFKQVQAAFFWNKPAIISSHRVNYCGFIDENNRKVGLDNLRKLLKKIVQVYPDVEFVSVDQIAQMICNDK